MEYLAGAHANLMQQPPSEEGVEALTDLCGLVGEAAAKLPQHSFFHEHGNVLRNTLKSVKVEYESQQLQEAAVKYTVSGEIEDFQKWWARTAERETWTDGSLSKMLSVLVQNLLSFTKEHLSDLTESNGRSDATEANTSSLMKLAKEVAEACLEWVVRCAHRGSVCGPA